jgi:hypothetical protein
MDPVPETDVFEADSYDSESSDCSPSGKVSISVSARYTSEDDEPHWETELRRALARLATAIVRGAGAGLTIRGGLHAASGAWDDLRQSWRNAMDSDTCNLTTGLSKLLNTQLSNPSLVPPSPPPWA